MVEIETTEYVPCPVCGRSKPPGGVDGMCGSCAAAAHKDPPPLTDQIDQLRQRVERLEKFLVIE